MAQAASEVRARYPLSLYNFRVRVEEAAMSFSEVSGLQIEYGLTTYRHGLSFWEGEDIRTYKPNVFVPMTCKRGLIAGARMLYLYNWLGSRRGRSLDVCLCDPAGAPVITWAIAVAVPIKLEAPSFSSSSNEVAIESLELRVRGITVVEA